MKNQKLHLDQLERKLSPYGKAKQSERPEIGWIKTIRKSLGMSLEQLGRKMGLSKQSIQSMEKRETTGAITISSLNEVAKALDMELVYGFVPKGGSVMNLVEERRRKWLLKLSYALHKTCDSKIKVFPTSELKKQLPIALKKFLKNSRKHYGIEIRIFNRANSHRCE